MASRPGGKEAVATGGEKEDHQEINQMKTKLTALALAFVLSGCAYETPILGFR